MLQQCQSRRLHTEFLLRRRFSMTGLVSETLCYLVLIQEPKNWTEAQSFCRKFHLDLATVQSDQDRAMIKEINSLTSLRAWIGLYDSVNSWCWSFQGQNIVYTNWGLNEDTTSSTQRMCGMIKYGGTWHVVSCDEQKDFFCYTGNNTGQKFLLFKQKLTWHDALQYCRRYHRDLAIIRSLTDNRIIENLMALYSVFDTWIGLSNNLWLWSDQSSVSWLSLKWISGEPDNRNGNEKCGFVLQSGLIGDKGCLEQIPFFCTKRRQMQLVRVAVKSSGHLDESAVMAAVEEKINQILKEQNMDAGSSLTWKVQPNGKIFQQQKNDTQNTRTKC
ncbi:putative C-type lectin domain family 20 member A [Megalobrama amblycephala]|uniref:putative C-type lectin domain family 20 member A n=1 Tax=Megalobrama amblycephala TaxID=75352 RepID=UPI002014242A|nr:putative C-type lectin domain family 20 member A [Megalobrama amblycephala]